MKLTFLGPNDPAKLLSFLFAIILWFHVATEQVYRYGASVPIHYVHLQDNYMLANTPPERVQVSLSGTGKSLLSFRLRQLSNPDDSYAMVDLAGLEKGTHPVAILKQNLFIPESDGITAQEITGNGVFPLVIDRRAERMVPVSTDSLPSFVEEGCVLAARPEAVPESVAVSGPEEIVSKITSIPAGTPKPAPITCADSVAQAQLINPSPFLDLSRDTVEIRFTVERLRTKLFLIPVTLTGFPRNERDTITPDTLSVLIQGPESVISRSGQADVSAEVSHASYLEQTASGDSLIAPTLRFPTGVTSASATPPAVRIWRRPR